MTRPLRLKDLPGHVQPRNKYSAKRVEVDGMRFDSKKEAARYGELKALRAAGHVSHFLRQVPLHLPGQTVYRVDFVVFWADGRVTYEDVKGVETKEFRMKKRMVEELYPIEIEVRK